MDPIRSGCQFYPKLMYGLMGLHCNTTSGVTMSRPLKLSGGCVWGWGFCLTFIVLDFSPLVFNNRFTVGSNLGFVIVSAGSIPTPFSLSQIHLYKSIAFTDVFLPENMETLCLIGI